MLQRPDGEPGFSECITAGRALRPQGRGGPGRPSGGPGLPLGGRCHLGCPAHRAVEDRASRRALRKSQRLQDQLAQVQHRRRRHCRDGFRRRAGRFHVDSHRAVPGPAAARPRAWPGQSPVLGWPRVLGSGAQPPPVAAWPAGGRLLCRVRAAGPGYPAAARAAFEPARHPAGLRGRAGHRHRRLVRPVGEVAAAGHAGACAARVRADRIRERVRRL